MPRTFRRDHDHVDVLRRNDRLKMNGKTVTEKQCLTISEIRFNLLFVNRRSFQIGRRKENDIGLFYRIRHVERLESMFFRYRNRLAALVETYDHIDPTILEVEGMGMPLRTEPNHRAGLSLQVFQVGVLIGIPFCGHKAWREKELFASAHGDTACPSQIADPKILHQTQE